MVTATCLPVLLNFILTVIGFSLSWNMYTLLNVLRVRRMLREITCVTCIFCIIILHFFSCKPFYRYKSMVVSDRVIACDQVGQNRNTILWAKFKNCTKILCCDSSPSVYERCDSWFAQIVFNFILTKWNVYRVHDSQEHWLSVSFDTFPFCDQSTSKKGVRLVSLPDVVDLIGEVIR